jgi:NAD dependent epimerase/dehydratase
MAGEGDGFWAGRSVLVTGAAGFIGSHAVEAVVHAGGRVRAFVRYNSRNDHGWLESLDAAVLAEVEVFRGDLANPEAVAGGVAGTDVVLHLGALIPIPYSYRHPREYVAANVEGALNILEAVRRASPERLVHVSSSEVYGTAMAVPIDEEHPLRAQSPYAATKVAADQLVRSFRHSFEIPVVVARPFNTFGPRQSTRAVIPTIIAQALARPSIELGSLAPTRDFLYVRDTVAGIMRCAEAPGVEGEVINLGSGRELSIGQVVEKVLALLEIELPVVQADERLRPEGSEVERLLADVGKARRLLGWEPSVAFDDGLAETVEWFRRFLGSYKPAVYST